MHGEVAQVARQTPAPRPPRPSDSVIETADRLNNRLNGLLANLRDLRERVSGSRPPEEDRSNMAETQFALGGFVGNAGQALERSHRLLGDIEETVANIADVI